MKPANVTQKAVCIIVNIESIGTSRKVPTSHVEVQADAERINVSKTLLQSEELSAIKRRDGFGRQWLYSRCIPNKVIKSGVFLCPIALIEQVEIYMVTWQAERTALVNKLAGIYETLVANDRIALKSEFVAEDYPGVKLRDDGTLKVNSNALAACFNIDWQFVAFETPSSLKQVSAEFFEAAKVKESAKWASVSEDVMYAIRSEARGLISNMVDKLTGKDDGKPKIFRNTLVTNMNDFLDLFDAKNVAGDQELSKLISNARQIMAGVTADTLRQQEPLRDSVRAQFAKLDGQLDAMLQDKPQRMITFEEEAA